MKTSTRLLPLLLAATPALAQPATTSSLAPAAGGLPTAHPRAAAGFKTVFPIPGVNDGAAPHAALIEFNGAYYGTTASAGDNGKGTVFTIDATTGAETTLYSFKGSASNDGDNPQGALVELQGILYGTTVFGGHNGAGTVFKIDPATGTETTLYSFTGKDDTANPNGGLAVFNGNLYGTTNEGGPAMTGTIFTINPDTGAEFTLYTFGTAAKDGVNPAGGMTLVGQTFYGTTGSDNQAGDGTVYSFDPATNTETPLRFLKAGDGAAPGGPLLYLNGICYGTASQGADNDYGSVFTYTPGTGTFSVLYRFKGNSDGGNPEAGLIASGTTLYGTTSGRFTGRDGSVFSIDASTGKETSLHAFSGGPDGGIPTGELLENGGILYGTAQVGGDTGYGVVFAIDPVTDAETIVHNFASVTSFSIVSGLTRVGSTLYGSSTVGGTYNYGAIFQVDAASGAGTVTYSFKGGTDGINPSGLLTDISGTLYGTTQLGGVTNHGTAFKLDSQGNRTTLHDFAGGTDGASPQGGLAAGGALLYGTTAKGGASNDGTVFDIDPGTGAETILHSFSGGADGTTPVAPLINVNGTLYGTTELGGTDDTGIVFAIDTKTGTETTVYSLDPVGEVPDGQLSSAGGLLYGTTSGLFEQVQGGTVFSLNPSTGAATLLHHFTDDANGETPFGGVIDVRGTLYGTTTSAGLGYGTVFSLDPVTGALNTLYSFTGGKDSGVPRASLVKAGGYLWGTTGAGAGNAGTVFRIKP